MPSGFSLNGDVDYVTNDQHLAQNPSKKNTTFKKKQKNVYKLLDSTLSIQTK